MTQYGGISELIISDLAQFFYDYTLRADSELSDLRLKSTEFAFDEPVVAAVAAASPAKDVAEPEIPVFKPEENLNDNEVIPEPSPGPPGSKLQKLVICGLTASAVSLLLLYGCRTMLSKRNKNKK